MIAAGPATVHGSTRRAVLRYSPAPVIVAGPDCLAPPTGPWYAEVRYGPATDQLLARSRGARLLVVGSYGDVGWSGMLAGSTALPLVSECSCPLAVVRGPHPGVPPPRGGPVVVGVDETDAGAEALEFAAGLASIGEHRHLVAVHTYSDLVRDLTGHPHRIDGDLAELGRRGAELLERRLRPVLRRHPELRVRRHVLSDTPLRALLDHATPGVAGGGGTTPHRVRRRAAGGIDQPGAHRVRPVPGCGDPARADAGASGAGNGGSRAGGDATVTTRPTRGTTARVRELMSAPVLTTTPRTKATDAALVIAMRDITALPVLDDGRLVGMFTEVDLVRRRPATAQAALAVEDVMTRVALVATPDCDAAELADTMRRRGMHVVPVLENGRLVGIITENDLRGLAG